MKRKLLVLFCAFAMCFVLVGCGGGDEPAAEPKEPLDLTGTWTEEEPADTYHEAVIKDGTIEINWISDGGETKSLYWAGTYKAPEEATDEYSWTSDNDKEKTDSALLASDDDTKEFTYTDGKLTYEASAMGTTKTVNLIKK